ncbi:MAG: CopD family protein [Pseudomonadota bacterium]
MLAALAAAAFSAARIGARAWFLTGESITQAADPAILSIVSSSPLGNSLTLRLTGLALIAAVLLPGRAFAAIATFGALLAAASFALRGHALGEPRALLAALYTVHILALGFWVGGLRPLHDLARAHPPTAALLAAEFGRKALVAVALLAASGALVLLTLSGGAVTTTLWGRLILLKLLFFGGLMLLAAANKLWLTPALKAGHKHAPNRLRASIRWEARIMLAMLAVTAILTSIAGPSGEG